MDKESRGRHRSNMISRYDRLVFFRSAAQTLNPNLLPDRRKVGEEMTRGKRKKKKMEFHICLGTGLIGPRRGIESTKEKVRLLVGTWPSWI